MKSLLPHIEVAVGELPIELVSCKLEVKICGLLTETQQTMVFHNPNARPLEGSLLVPLPNGAVVCGYAIDVNGVLLDGVTVPKEQARQILETEIRKGIDPGLVEQVQGNLYRTRVYPLPAGGQRTVQLTYSGQVDVDGGFAAYKISPSPEGSQLSTIQLELQVLGYSEPQCELGSFELSQGLWKTSIALPQAEELLVRLGQIPAQLSALESLSADETFFMISVESTRKPSRSPWSPKRLGVVWDASSSRQELTSELELLQEIGELWPYCGIDLVILREVVEPLQSFINGQEAAKFLATVTSDGATALAALDLESHAAGIPIDAWLLFSDGLSTVQAGLPKIGSLPIYTVCSQRQQNSKYLSHIAERSGGRFLNLSSGDSASLQRGLQLLSQGSPNSDDTVELLSEAGISETIVVRAPDRVHLFGRLTADNPVARFRIAGRTHQFERSASPNPAMGRLLARAWAAHKAAELELDPALQPSLVELGRRYGLVTAGTSLLVLESLEQYLEYDLEPPSSLPHLQEAFQLRRREIQHEQDNQRRERLDRVADLWKQRTEWWEKDFRPQWELAPEEQFKEQDEASQILCSRAPAPMMSFAGAAFGGAAECEPMMDIASRDFASDDEGGDEPAAAGPQISIQAWDPQTPYLESLKAASDPYQAYLSLLPKYRSSPSFFLDCSNFLIQGGQKAQGLRVLSNLSEIAVGEPGLLRIQAWRLQQAGELDLAIQILEQVLTMRADEPQSYRDLALVLVDRFEREIKRQAAATKQTDRPLDDANRAAQLLYEVVSRQWDRFPEIEIIALMELNRLLDVATRLGHVIELNIDPRLRASLALDLRISLAWDADLTDVDLHVIEPTTERASYRNQNTRIGGRVSRDFREGYGPEEYVLRRALAGPYEILAHYYGSHQQTLVGPCTVLATVFTNYARSDEKREYLTLRLDQPSQEVVVGAIRWS